MLLLTSYQALHDFATELVSAMETHGGTARLDPSLVRGQLAVAQADTGPPESVNLADLPIHRSRVLGGLTHEYCAAA